VKQSLERKTFIELLAYFQITRPFGNAVLTLALVLQTSACIKRAPTLVATHQYANDQRSTSALPSTQTRININTASVSELETLPGIGKSLAERIVEHRHKFGPFRRPEHLIIVRGVSDKRFRALRDLITVE
jgi:competence ComEA-like helix-hairpin-helix protein